MSAKWVYLGQRNPRLSRAEFLQRWLKHRTMGAPPAMGAEFVTADYCAIQTSPPPLAGISTEYDAAGLFALASLAAIPLVAQFLKADYIQADEKRFFNTTSENFSMFCAEDVVRDGEYTKTVVIQFFRRVGNLGPTAFTQQWRERHGGMVLSGLPAVSRYVQNTVIAPPPPGFGYDGIAELWFDAPESVAAAARELDDLMTDPTLLDTKNSFCLLTDVIISRAKKNLISPKETFHACCPAHRPRRGAALHEGRQHQLPGRYGLHRHVSGHQNSARAIVGRGRRG